MSVLSLVLHNEVRRWSGMIILADGISNITKIIVFTD